MENRVSKKVEKTSTQGQEPIPPKVNGKAVGRRVEARGKDVMEGGDHSR